MSVQSSIFSQAHAGRTWIPGSIAVLLVLFIFGEGLVELIRRWSIQEEYSHGFLIPVVTTWLLWTRRDALIAGVSRPAWSGPALILMAGLLHILSRLSAILIISQLAFLIALLGMALAVGGFPLLRVCFIPIAFLIFAIPLPYFINAGVSLELQLLSSRLGVAFIKFFAVPVYLEGNVIDLGTYKLQVVEACSGLRYLFPLLSLSFLAAYLFRAPIWQRAIVLLSSIPITIAMNGFRIGLIGVTVDRWGPLLAEGVLHIFEGWVIFAASALLLVAEIYLLARLSGRRFFECFGALRAAPPAPRRTVVSATDHRPFAACLLLLLATLCASAFITNRVEVIPARSRFVTFPTKISDWQGHPSLLDPQVERGLALDDYILSDFTDLNGKVVNLYVAYYASQHGGKYHSPLVCIPGDGWSISTFRRTSYGADRPINRALIERNGVRQLVYYWYQERGRQIASEYWSRWYLLYDAIMMDRSDGALVRVITPIASDESDEDADHRLRRFIHAVEPTLTRFLPSGESSGTRLAAHRPENMAE
jgi:exosortase D (VPLPA-CTERM-specific)